MKKIRIEIDGMSCEGCVSSVENSIKGLEGVKKVKVSLKDEDVVVGVSDDVKIEDIKSKIKEAGYESGGVLGK